MKTIEELAVESKLLVAYTESLKELPFLNEARELHIERLTAFAEAYHAQKEAKKWISVKDRLPDEYCRVLVFRAKNGFSIGNWFKRHDDEIFWTIGSTSASPDSMEYPILWQPLPPLPISKDGE